MRYEKGNISDGYHTFNELYHHRAVLFANVCNTHPCIAWKSRKHDDGTMFEGMFIAGIQTPKGQCTYHLDNEHWDKYKVQELDRAPKWDGHTPTDVLERMQSL